jgi:UDP-N-acetylmuramate dehydrogenase
MHGIDRLLDAFGVRLRANVPLAPLTTFRLGGAADWLIELRDPDEVRRLVEMARDSDIPLTIVGGGSNLLVADAGVKGIVARVHGGDVRLLSPDTVRADAGVTINGLVRWTIGHGLAALEAWAGTPGTVGGAIYGNAHFQGRPIADLVRAVTLVTRAGALREVPAAEMAFAYDYSRLHRTREIVLSADFAVTPGDPEALRAVARASLAFRKRTQPLALASAGCIFQNPDPSTDVLPPGLPYSAGALVDRAGLKGAAEGGARVSPVHANFIVNEGQATAADVRRLIARCKAVVRERFGVDLREEIVYLGFDGDSHGNAAD